MTKYPSTATGDAKTPSATATALAIAFSSATATANGSASTAAANTSSPTPLNVFESHRAAHARQWLSALPRQDDISDPPPPYNQVATCSSAVPLDSAGAPVPPPDAQGPPPPPQYARFDTQSRAQQGRDSAVASDSDSDESVDGPLYESDDGGVDSAYDADEESNDGSLGSDDSDGDTYADETDYDPAFHGAVEMDNEMGYVTDNDAASNAPSNAPSDASAPVPAPTQSSELQPRPPKIRKTESWEAARGDGDWE